LLRPKGLIARTCRLPAIGTPLHVLRSLKSPSVALDVVEFTADGGVLGLGFSARVFDAIVFFECFLCETVKGERGNGAFEARLYYAPGAVRTAPAGEFVFFEPDHAGWHTTLFIRMLGSNQAQTGGTPGVRTARKGELLPVATDNLAQNFTM
jgi:hypothetical protein